MIYTISFLTAIIGLIIYTIYESRAAEVTHNEEYLDYLYKKIWTGHEYDRVHAWHRVIANLELTDQWHLVPEARRRLKVLRDDRISDSYVNVNGSPVLRREMS